MLIWRALRDQKMTEYGIQDSHVRKHQNFIISRLPVSTHIIKKFATLSRKNLHSASPVLYYTNSSVTVEWSALGHWLLALEGSTEANFTHRSISPHRHFWKWTQFLFYWTTQSSDSVNVPLMPQFTPWTFHHATALVPTLSVCQRPS